MFIHCGRQEFIMSPVQLGIPYSRPRYFALARRCNSSNAIPAFQIPMHPPGHPFRQTPEQLLQYKASQMMPDAQSTTCNIQVTMTTNSLSCTPCRTMLALSVQAAFTCTQSHRASHSCVTDNLSQICNSQQLSCAVMPFRDLNISQHTVEKCSM